MSACRYCTGTGIQPDAPAVATDDVNRCATIGHYGTRCTLAPHGPTYAHQMGRAPLAFVDDDEAVPGIRIVWPKDLNPKRQETKEK